MITVTHLWEAWTSPLIYASPIQPGKVSFTWEEPLKNTSAWYFLDRRYFRMLVKLDLEHLSHPREKLIIGNIFINHFNLN